MEVKVEAVDGEVPDDCFIAVRFGGVQKQARYDAAKLYSFPFARRFGKVELFQRIGTCEVVWEADEPESRTCRAVGQHGDDTGIALRISMARPPEFLPPQPARPSALVAANTPSKTDVADGKQQASEKKIAADESDQYLKEKDVRGMLAGATRALLKAMPEDAASFLCDYIRTHHGKATRTCSTNDPCTSDSSVAVCTGDALSLTAAKSLASCRGGTVAEPAAQVETTGVAQKAASGSEAPDKKCAVELRAKVAGYLGAALENGELIKALEDIASFRQPTTQAASEQAVSGAPSHEACFGPKAHDSQAEASRPDGQTTATSSIQTASAKVLIDERSLGIRKRLDEIKATVRASLVQACDSGELAQALQTIPDEPADARAAPTDGDESLAALRLRVAESLCVACERGKLGMLLAAGEADKPTLRGDSGRIDR